MAGWVWILAQMACDQFSNVIKKSKTILWNGPMGVFEMPKFQHGTKSVAVAIAEATEEGAYSLVGGGDSCFRSKSIWICTKSELCIHRRRRNVGVL